MLPNVIYKTPKIEPRYQYLSPKEYHTGVTKNRLQHYLEIAKLRGETQFKCEKVYIKDGSIVTEDITDQIKTETKYIIP